MKPKNTYCRDRSVCGVGTFFHHEAILHNLQNNRNAIKIGRDTHIRGEILVFAHKGKINIGDYCYIGAQSRIWSAGEIVIGDRVLIAHNVNIHDNNAHPTDPIKRHEQQLAIITSGHPSTALDLNEKPVYIDDDAWIGFNATILKGVHIGKGAIVGACSVVTEDIPDYSIAVGNPAKVIGKVSLTT